jgi:hypothetical protein
MSDQLKAASYSPVTIDNINEEVLDTKLRNIRKELSRHSIALWFIFGYLILLTVTFAVPTIVFLLARPATPVTVVDFKDLLQAYSGALTGLTGILGFVVGYYFKSEERTSTEVKTA